MQNRESAELFLNVLMVDIQPTVSNTYATVGFIWGWQNLMPFDGIIRALLLAACLLVVLGLEPSTLKMQNNYSADFHIPHIH